MPLETEMETCGRKDGRTGRWERVNFKILLSYNGASFDGWQKQPDLHTVQRSVFEFFKILCIWSFMVTCGLEAQASNAT